jgi:hypothetical protein
VVLDATEPTNLETPVRFSQEILRSLMDAKIFNHCCGAAELGNFGSAVSGKDVASMLQCIRDGKSQDGYAFLSESSPGYVISTTSSECSSSVIKALKANRFRVLSRFKNPRSGHLVTLWGRKL